MIAGLESISSGTLSIDDRVVNQVRPRNATSPWCFQSYALYPHMSVKDISPSPQAPRRRARRDRAPGGRGRRHARARGPVAASRTRCPVASGQRVALAALIVRDPKCSCSTTAVQPRRSIAGLDRGELAKLHRRPRARP